VKAEPSGRRAHYIVVSESECARKLGSSYYKSTNQATYFAGLHLVVGSSESGKDLVNVAPRLTGSPNPDGLAF
jgi:hypothetical protein